MDLGLAGKAALITGASEGIGKYCGIALAAEGANVAICARRPDVLETARVEIDAAGPGKALAFTTDMGDGDDVRKMVDSAARELGRVDILINNMGASFRGEEDEVWQQMFELNLLAAIRATNAALPHLKETAGGGDAGVIIHVGSIYGREAGGAPGYQTMKSAIHSHAKALALQLASDNIRVNAIAPGSIAWPGSKWQTRYDDDPDTIQRTVLDGIAFGRFGKPEEVANLVAFLASPRASWVTGACINVDGGQTVSIN